MNRDVRITLTDTPMSAIIKMSGGNPGALTVLTEMYTEGGIIDPDDFMGGFGAILGLDSQKIYEHRIWMLYKDVCQQNMTHMLALLRAVQLGYLPDQTLDAAIDGVAPFTNEQVLAYLAQVQERLPAFGKE